MAATDEATGPKQRGKVGGTTPAGRPRSSRRTAKGGSAKRRPAEVPDARRIDSRALLDCGRTEVERLALSLATATDEVAATAQFRDWLATVSRFWRYSFWNQVLIRRQCPHAMRVGARSLWASLGRTVRAGEKPIGILAPSRGGGSRFFIGVEVFDVSQTEGAPLPSVSWAVTGGSPLLEVVEAAARRLDIRVEEVPGDGRFLGLTLGRHHVQVAKGLPPAERAATLVHEFAHALLHAHDAPKRRGAEPPSYLEKELQAEGAAFVVLQAAGQPSTAPTYLAAHFRGGVGLARVRESLRDIVRAARAILGAMAGDATPRRRAKAKRAKA